MSDEQSKQAEENLVPDAGEFDAVCEEFVELLYEKWAEERSARKGAITH